MANNDDYQRDDPNQWQQPGSPDQDLSAQSGAPYGLAGQGQMGDAMSRDVDPNMAGQMGQDPYQQQGNLGNQGTWDPNQQQAGQVGQDPYQQGGGNDQGMMAGGYGGNQPNPNQGGQQNITPAQGAPVQPNVGDPGMMGSARQQAEQQADSAIDSYADRVPGGEQHAQQAKDAVSDQLDNMEDQAQGRSGGLMDKLGNLFGRHGDQENPPDEDNM